LGNLDTCFADSRRSDSDWVDVGLNMCWIASGSWGCRGHLEQQPQPFDPAQDQGEQQPRDHRFRQLEHHAPGVMHDFAADLDEFVPQRRERPVFHTRRQCQLSQEAGWAISAGE